jgi:vacuolar-type H+-ATPase subunit I/STV1
LAGGYGIHGPCLAAGQRLVTSGYGSREHNEEWVSVLHPCYALLSVSSVSGTPPWVIRVAEIKANLAINVEAERKVIQLNDEIQALVRNLKAKDQHIQESSVKIELMERRMETVKKQADAIVDLESELSKARKQERSYEEAMEQLQADLDALEQDNVKLKAMAAGPERQSSLLPTFEVVYRTYVLTIIISVYHTAFGNGNDPD